MFRHCEIKQSEFAGYEDFLFDREKADWLAPARRDAPWRLCFDGVCTVVRLESSALSVDVLPGVGGKVAQIMDKVSGCGLLVPPQKAYRPIPVGGDWLTHDTSGMDDCFPNVAAGTYPDAPWTSAKLPDLGEWTHASWKVIELRSDALVMEMTGHALPYSAVKTIRFADERTIEFRYSVRNGGQFPLRYIWSAHPLFAVEGKYQIALPPGEMMFRLFPPDKRVYSWPALNGRNLSAEWIPRGTTLKVFVTGLTEGWCALVLPKHTLRFDFDLHTLPVVGIWFDNFGFPRDSARPFRCIALEPCTSPSDLLDNLGAHAYPRIPPGELREWSMQMTVAQKE
jgi:hypothetical protein